MDVDGGSELFRTTLLVLLSFKESLKALLILIIGESEFFRLGVNVSELG